MPQKYGQGSRRRTHFTNNDGQVHEPHTWPQPLTTTTTTLAPRLEILQNRPGSVEIAFFSATLFLARLIQRPDKRLAVSPFFVGGSNVW